jgi:hypothetical protein
MSMRGSMSDAIIGRVVEHPARLEPGVQWVVELTALGSGSRRALERRLLETRAAR